MNKRIALTFAALTLAAGTASLTACGSSSETPTWSSYAESVREVTADSPVGSDTDPRVAHEYADKLREIEDSPSASLNQATDDLADHMDDAGDAMENGDDAATTAAGIEVISDLTDIANEVSTTPQEVRDAWDISPEDMENLNTYNDNLNY